jgi:hypothetical protein
MSAPARLATSVVLLASLSAAAAAQDPPPRPPVVVECRGEDPPPAPPAPPEPKAADPKTAADQPKEPPKPPPTWHGHKVPVQPFVPPGAAPIPPTGPGFYTLLSHLRGEPSEKPPRWPYQRNGLIFLPFYEYDFSYLDPVPFDKRDWAEKLKRIPVHDHFLFSLGGEVRYRYNDETNSQLTDRDTDYGLFRTRLYGDLWYEDRARVYAEFLYGDIFNNELPPLARDVNRGDIQNLFADVKAGAPGGNPVYVRVGRQEILYGSQRLISTNDWGNNRTRFDMAKAFYRSEKWDFDVFTGRPVQARFNDGDPGDKDVLFTGAWLTHKPKKGTFLDAYYLNLDNQTNAFRGQFRSGRQNVSTVGGRFVGRGENGFLWDVEGMFQFGSRADQSIFAQAASAYVGWNFKDCPMNPTVWVGHDYASGDPDPGNTGTFRTFNQLFQFGHYYFGFLDYVGRQNIHDFTVQAYAYPAKWLTTGLQYHVFRLDSPKDALYNAFGRPVRRDPTGRAGNDVGQEIDFVLNAHLTDRQDVFLSYSRFFAGPFVRRTGSGTDGDAFYVQYSWRW